MFLYYVLCTSNKHLTRFDYFWNKNGWECRVSVATLNSASIILAVLRAAAGTVTSLNVISASSVCLVQLSSSKFVFSNCFSAFSEGIVSASILLMYCLIESTSSTAWWITFATQFVSVPIGESDSSCLIIDKYYVETFDLYPFCKNLYANAFLLEIYCFKKR